ncbi:MAG: hypothetical protein Q9208_007261 [Pyrenodesmia sp. 3 TL-2023]
MERWEAWRHTPTDRVLYTLLPDTIGKTPEGSVLEKRSIIVPPGKTLYDMVLREDISDSCTQPTGDELIRNQTCNICLGPFTPEDNAKKLPCGHVYGLACLAEWSSGKTCSTCLACRTPYLHSDPIGQLRPQLAPMRRGLYEVFSQIEQQQLENAEQQRLERTEQLQLAQLEQQRLDRTEQQLAIGTSNGVPSNVRIYEWLPRSSGFPSRAIGTGGAGLGLAG